MQSYGYFSIYTEETKNRVLVNTCFYKIFSEKHEINKHKIVIKLPKSKTTP